MHENTNKPFALRIFGIANLVVFGLLSLLSIIYLGNNPQELKETVLTSISESAARPQAINENMIRITLLVVSIIPVFFMISGAGILFQKKWAGKFTLYFSFAVVVIIFLGVLMQPALITKAILQIIYPGILIVYFSSAGVKAHFEK